MLSFQEVRSGDDRCVFQKGNEFYKVYLTKEKGKDFQREYFLGKTLSTYHSNKNDHIVKTERGSYNMDDTTFNELTQIGLCGKTIEAEPPQIPLIVTKNIGGEDLSAWLTKRNTAIGKDVIETFAFQLIWIIGEMHSQFGIQHNDIQETNIRVKEITGGPKTLRYKCKNDVFEIVLQVGHLEVLLIDFGSATLKKQEKYPTKDFEPWENPDVAFLTGNNCPEYFFNDLKTPALRAGKRNSECDLFMIGHVLLTLHLHANGFDNFKYQPALGIHIHKIQQDAANLSTPLTVSKLSQLVHEKIFPPKNDVYKTYDATTDSANAVEIFLINLVALGVAIHGYDTTMEFLTKYDTSVIGFANQIETTPSYKGYVETRFQGLLSKCGDSKSQSFIQKLMYFDPRKRRGPLNHSLTGYLFHPYFAPFYKGNVTTVTNIDYVIPFFAPPFEYSETTTDSYSKILMSIKKYEEDINSDIEKQMTGFKAYLKTLDKTTSSGRFTLIDKTEIENLTDTQIKNIKENYIKDGRLSKEQLTALVTRLGITIEKKWKNNDFENAILTKMSGVVPEEPPKKATPAADAEKAKANPQPQLPAGPAPGQGGLKPFLPKAAAEPKKDEPKGPPPPGGPAAPANDPSASDDSEDTAVEEKKKTSNLPKAVISENVGYTFRLDSEYTTLFGRKGNDGSADLPGIDVKKDITKYGIIHALSFQSKHANYSNETITIQKLLSAAKNNFLVAPDNTINISKWNQDVITPLKIILDRGTIKDDKGKEYELPMTDFAPIAVQVGLIDKLGKVPYWSDQNKQVPGTLLAPLPSRKNLATSGKNQQTMAFAWAQALYLLALSLIPGFKEKDSYKKNYAEFQKTVQKLDGLIQGEGSGRKSYIITTPVKVDFEIWERAESYLETVPLVANAYNNLELYNHTVQPKGATIVEQTEFDRRLSILGTLLDKLDSVDGEGSFSIEERVDFVTPFETPWRHQQGQVYDI